MSARTRDAALLVAGALLVFLTFMRFSIALCGWIAFAPFLAYLHAGASRRRHLAVLGVLVAAFLATVAKIRTWEIPWAPVPLFAVPLAVSYFAAVAFGSAAHRRLGAAWGTWSFAAAAAVLGWVQYSFTPGSSWAALAHSQMDELVLVQLASLGGLGALTFLVAAGSGIAAAVWDRGWHDVRGVAAAFALLVAAALAYGTLRLGAAAPGPFVRVAAVASPVTHREFRAARLALDTLRAYDSALFARSERAAALGAHIVAWDEMATIIAPAQESAFTARGRALARAHGVVLVMAYGVAESMRPFRDANKYRLYLPDGTLADEYVKRHPVPGDPERPGEAHARVVTIDGVAISGAICYDFGFPAIARDLAHDGARLAIVPSSDWHGIDPTHGRMARMNAVAVGLPMVRPVRAATSIATDQYGRILAAMPWETTGDGIMLAVVPASRVPTPYAALGEWVPLLALAYCAAGAARMLAPRRR